MKRWFVAIVVFSIVLFAGAGDALGRHGHPHSRSHFGVGLHFVVPVGPIYHGPYHSYYPHPYPYPGCYYECYPRYYHHRYYPISLTGHDLFLQSIKTQHALENVPSGVEMRWLNPETGAGGYVRVQPAFKNSLGQDCRRFERAIARGKQLERTYGTACRLPGGHWELNPALP